MNLNNYLLCVEKLHSLLSLFADKKVENLIEGEELVYLGNNVKILDKKLAKNYMVSFLFQEKRFIFDVYFSPKNHITKEFIMLTMGCEVTAEEKTERKYFPIRHPFLTGLSEMKTYSQVTVDNFENEVRFYLEKGFSNAETWVDQHKQETKQKELTQEKRLEMTKRLSGRGIKFVSEGIMITDQLIDEKLIQFLEEKNSQRSRIISNVKEDQKSN